MSGSVDESFVAVDTELDLIHHPEPHHHIHHHHHHHLSPHQQQQQQFSASLATITNASINNKSMVVVDDSLDTHCQLLEGTQNSKIIQNSTKFHEN